MHTALQGARGPLTSPNCHTFNGKACPDRGGKYHTCTLCWHACSPAPCTASNMPILSCDAQTPTALCTPLLHTPHMSHPVHTPSQLSAASTLSIYTCFKHTESVGGLTDLAISLTDSEASNAGARPTRTHAELSCIRHVNAAAIQHVII